MDETVYIDGDDFFNSLKNSLINAKSSIHLETYIFEQDQTGLTILNLLADAVRRGVRVQLLLDGLGSATWTFADASVWRQKGIELKFFHALPWQKHPSSIWRLLTLKKITIGFFKLNRRNHRKICLIDGSLVFVSSMNISDRHLPSIRGDLAWRDVGVKIKNASNKNYFVDAQDTWNFSQQHHGHHWRKISKQKKQEYKFLLKSISHAKNRIWITNPYFVPDFRLTRAICRSAKNGVDVKILLPNRSDIFGLKFATESFYHALLAFKVEIYEFGPTMLHAKILIVDDWVSVGSFNLDFRSIFYNLETSAILSEFSNIEIIEKQFAEDIKTSTKIELHSWKERSWMHRGLEKFFLLFHQVRIPDRRNVVRVNDHNHNFFHSQVLSLTG